MIDYIVDGIPDKVLQDQAHVQRFTDIESLLAAFEAVTLQDRRMISSNRPDKRSGKSAVGERNSATSRNEREGSTNGEKKKATSSIVSIAERVLTLVPIVR